jgi:ankyrin repeat protein
MAALMLPPSQMQRYYHEDAFNSSLHGRHETLHMALQQENPRLDVDWVQPGNETTAAHAAAHGGYAQCLSVLVSHNADLSKANKQGHAPIHTACERGRYACIEVLLDNGVSADLRTASRHGTTPLILACQNGHAKCMALLLDRGADPSKASRYGITAAHRACEDGYLKGLQLLSNRGADLNKRSIEDETPLDWARRFRHPECIAFLQTPLACVWRTSVPCRKL